MRKLAKATLAEVEKRYPRDIWDDDAEGLTPDDLATLYLDESNDDAYLFIADCEGRYLFSDSVEDIPREWFDAESLQFYFKATIEEFTTPGFLERFFSDED
jgi:hypothetical protein